MLWKSVFPNVETLDYHTNSLLVFEKLNLPVEKSQSRWKLLAFTSYYQHSIPLIKTWHVCVIRSTSDILFIKAFKLEIKETGNYEEIELESWKNQ